MPARISEVGSAERFVQESVYCREYVGDSERVRIGGAPVPVDLLCELVRDLSEPVFVLVEVRVARVTDFVAKYESEPWSIEQVVEFATTFRDFFTLDGRANLWVGEIGGPGMLVLDEHDILFGYGHVDEFERKSHSAGYVAGNPTVPDPHEHCFREEFDEDELRIVEMPWRRVLPAEDD
ncbi:MAG: hypothetical protein JHD02_04810 [Thermoleophilaceae bacterium]|nr:hypothetical protein [Thermoleophilaceae bacterium]